MEPGSVQAILYEVSSVQATLYEAESAGLRTAMIVPSRLRRSALVDRWQPLLFGCFLVIGCKRFKIGYLTVTQPLSDDFETKMQRLLFSKKQQSSMTIIKRLHKGCNKVYNLTD